MIKAMIIRQTEPQSQDAQIMERLLQAGAMIEVVGEDFTSRSDGTGTAGGLAESSPQVPAGEGAARRHGKETDKA